MDCTQKGLFGIIFNVGRRYRTMKRYTQPKAGTNDKVVKKDMDYNAINPKTRMGNLIESLQYIYKGRIDNDWQ